MPNDISQLGYEKRQMLRHPGMNCRDPVLRDVKHYAVHDLCVSVIHIEITFYHRLRIEDKSICDITAMRLSFIAIKYGLRLKTD